MPDNQQQVDGFSDNTSEEKLATRGEQAGVPGSPDPGMPKGAKPMDPEEFARMKKEASEENSEQNKDR